MRYHNTILGSLIGLGLTANIAALPQDPTPIHGQVQIQNNGANFLQILQTTPQAIVNWNQFNIGLGETVRFLQPSQQAAILNRVTGVDPSLIQGMLQANGRVFLLNPNGILFGPNSVVDVGSFTASTLKMSNEDFLNGSYRLTQDGSLPLAALTNQGQIQVAEGGFVVLVSPLLDNQGVILAQSGHVNLGATTQATFSVDGRGLVQFVVPDGFNPQFTGGGQGGTVLLQPGQMSQLLTQVVSNPTLVEAGSFQPGNQGQTLAHGAEGLLLNSGTINTDGMGGTIRLDSSQASILPASGLLSANSQSGNAGEVRLLSAGKTMALGTITAAANGTGQGGFVEVSGKDLWLLGNVDVGSAGGLGGTILLDPTDITIIDGAGGTFDGGLPTPGNSGAGTVSVTAMQGQSAVNLIATNDVTYNGAGFNLSATALTVAAGNDILFNTTGSIQAATLDLNATRDLVIAGSGSLTVASNNALTLAGGRNVAVTANGALTLSSPSQTTVRALTGNVSLRSGQGSGTFLNGPRTNLSAGANITLTQSDLVQNTGGAVNLAAGNDVSLLSTASGGVFVNLASLNVTAAQDFVGNASNGNFALTTGGDLKLDAGRNLDIRSTASTTVVSNSGSTTLRAQNIQIATGADARVRGAAGVSVNATVSDFTLNAGTNALEISSSAGEVRADAARDINLQARSSLTLSSPVKTTMRAARDLNLSSGQNNGTFLNGPRTDLSAGRNLTSTQSDLVQNTGGAVNLAAGNDVSLLSTASGGLLVNLASLNVTAAQDFVGNASNGNFAVTTGGDLRLDAARNLDIRSTASTTAVSNSGSTTLRAQNIQISTGADARLRGAAGVSVNATVSDFTMNAGTNALEIGSSGGEVGVDAARDVNLQARSSLTLSSPVKTTIKAARDLNLSSGQGNGTFLNGPRTDLSAGRNLTSTQSDLAQNTGGAVNLAASNDVSLLSTASGGLLVNLASLNVTAAQDFVGNASNGNFAVTTGGDLRLDAARNLDLRSSGSTTAFANSGSTTLRAQNIQIATGGDARVRGATGVSVNATVSDFTMNAGANALDISSSGGEVRVDAARDVNLQAASSLTLSSPVKTTVKAARDLNLRSGQGSGTFLNGPRTDLGAGRNLTSTQSDLVQNTGGAVNLDASNDVSLLSTASGGLLVNLASLNVTAAQDFVGNASNGNFAVTTGGDLRLDAARNLDLRSSGSTTAFANSGSTTLRAQNIQIATGGDARVRGAAGVSVNATVSDFTLNAGTNALDISSSGGEVRVDAARDVNLQAASSLTLSSPVKTTVKAARDLNLRSGQGSGTFLNGPRTDLGAGRNLTSTQSDLVQNTGGAVNLDASNDLSLLSTGSGGLFVNLASLNVTAAQDLVGNASNGNFQVQTSGGLGFAAGRNLRLGATGSVLFSAPGNVSAVANNVTVQSGANFIASSGGANVSLTASDTLDLNTGGTSNLNAPNGNVTVGAGGSLNLDGSTLLVAGSGARILSGSSSAFKPGSSVTTSSAGIEALATGNLDLRQLNLTSNGNGPVNLQSGANLTVGRLATATGGTANLTGANIIVDSMDRISGGNYTITTPGNLTELNPATNPPVLAALNISAGRAFNTNANAANSSFSIPNTASPANLTVLVTAGNDSVFNSSASFQNFGGDVQPGFIAGQTGDIYVDGVLFYGGEPPPPMPPTPVPPDPIVEPIVAAAVAAQESPLTPEQRSQILAQSNLALGNLGSFSRVLSDSERERLTVRQDSLNQTWALDPFSPTLALTLPGGQPLVYPSELRGLEALLRMSTPGDDPEEKARGAYNVIVDQELREIWEIRYWRHLLEGFVIWEDRE